MIPALLFRNDELRNDPALKMRGARKLVVTQLNPASERIADEVVWRAPASPVERCAVQVMPDTEVAVFNQHAQQTRHCHRLGTEMYMVLEGMMTIEVEGEMYQLAAGDMIIVNPGARHEVKRLGQFLCRVVTVHCGGAADKYSAP
ncbi:cupin domain-containing protein [Fontivita pretiosa]|uniref:cupin domain-containing protein n=1 Tax=Fontivita pretiosa TaxID=2989684 RepID=UPI003D164DA3